MDAPPQVYLCASAADTMLVEALRARLTQRGLHLHEGGELGPPTPSDERQRAIDQSDLLLVVISHANARSPVVTADYRYALAQGKRVVPLLTGSARDLPPDLRETHASDFSRSEAEGWASLLITLDTFGMARYPIPAIPELDAELAVARARSGAVPPGWVVTRAPVAGPRRLVPVMRLGLPPAVLIFVGGYLASGRDPLVLLFGAFILLPMGLLSFQSGGPRLDKNGPTVVLTPEGVAVQGKTSIAWASFHEVSDQTPAGAPPDATMLRIVARSIAGDGTVDMPMSRLVPGELGQQALAFYLAWAARYRPDARHPAPQREATLPPVIFVSYARADAAAVDRLELALQGVGFLPWVDRSGLIGGQVWETQVREALDRCAALVVVVSPAAMRSDAVREEYGAALAAGKPVVGVLLQRTWRIPPALRPLVRADARQGLGIAMLEVSLALDERGVHAIAGYTLPNAYRIAQDPNLTLARALHGVTPPGGRLYRGGLPYELFFGTAGALLTILLFLGLYLVGGPLLFLILAATFVVLVAPTSSAAIARRWRYPDLVVTLPDGFIAFLYSASITFNPYSSLRSLAVGKARWAWGIPITMTGESGTPIVQWLPPTLRRRKAIAARIAEDFAAYQRSATPSSARTV